MLGVSLDFPVHKALKVVKDHVLVAFDLLVRKDDTQVNTGRVHLVLVLDLVLAEQFEMVLQDIGRFFSYCVQRLLCYRVDPVSRWLRLRLFCCLCAAQ